MDFHINYSKNKDDIPNGMTGDMKFCIGTFWISVKSKNYLLKFKTLQNIIKVKLMDLS